MSRRQFAEVPSPEAADNLDEGAAELQQLWFAATRREWSSLVLVPAQEDTSAHDLAKGLTDIAAVYRTQPIKLLTGQGLTMRSSPRLIIDLTTHVSSGGLVIASVDPIITNQAGIPVVLAADAALLVVEMGETGVKAARRTVELIGESRFVGCVTVRKNRR